VLKTIARLELARLLRHSPGVKSLLAVLCLPLLHVLPWQASEFFESAFQASVMVGALSALAIACVVGRDAGAPRRTSFWLFQKGVQPVDYALGAFVVTAGIMLVLMAAGCVVLAVGLWLRGEPVARTVGVVVVVSLVLALVIHVLLFVLAALRSGRTIETALLLVFLALVVDPVLMRAPASLRRAAHWLLPPISDAFHMTGALYSREWHTLLGHLTHVLLFLALAFAAALTLLARLRPAPARAHES
jgi:hypothetical protein